MRRVCCVAAVVIGFVSLGPAQDQSDPGKNEIAGTFGHTFVSNQGVLNSGFSNSIITFGAGYTFEVNYARILLDREWFDVAAEVPAILNPDEDLHYAANQVPQQYSSIFITPAVRLRFISNLAFSPWFSFGGGFGHLGSSANLVFGGNTTGNRSVTGGVLEGGVGLDVRIPCERFEHLKIRLEVRDDWSGVPALNVDTGKSRQHNYYIAVGVVYRF
ncbi:MAG TPA: hypothetical protein VJO35_14670 [Terriglobales bacterium]|nr:hypothetical protein [Terriglobales bacterium]